MRSRRAYKCVWFFRAQAGTPRPKFHETLSKLLKLLRTPVSAAVGLGWKALYPGLLKIERMQVYTSSETLGVACVFKFRVAWSLGQNVVLFLPAWWGQSSASNSNSSHGTSKGPKSPRSFRSGFCHGRSVCHIWKKCCFQRAWNLELAVRDCGPTRLHVYNAPHGAQEMVVLLWSFLLRLEIFIREFSPVPGTCISSLSSHKIPWGKWHCYPTCRGVACGIENLGNLTSTYLSGWTLNVESLTSKPMCWTASL